MVTLNLYNITYIHLDTGEGSVLLLSVAPQMAVTDGVTTQQS